MNTKINLTKIFFNSTLFICLLSAKPVNPSEFRAPVLLEQGPLRQLAEEEDSGYGMRYWASFYFSGANKAFSEHHGTKTQDISALFFHGGLTPKGDSPFDKGYSFRTTQMFQDWYVSEKTEFYNPLLRTSKLRLSVRYDEYGTVFGTVWDMPIIKNHGRIGLRASIPAKKIKVSKVDMEGVRQGAELQDVLSVQSGSTKGTATTDSARQNHNSIILVRMDFAEALGQSSDNNTALEFRNNGRVIACAGDVNFKPSTGSTVAGEPLPTVVGGKLPLTNQSNQNASSSVAIIHSPEGLVPRSNETNIVLVKASDLSTNSKQSVSDITGLKDGDFAIFYVGNDYTPLAETASQSLKTRKAMQDAKAQLWLCPIVAKDYETPTGTAQPNANDGKILSTLPNGVLSVMRNLADQVTENTYEWFHDKKIDFETYTKEGFGDLDIDFFYHHIFNKQLEAEASIGLKAPTGGRNKWDNNPYKVCLGNGGHWEVKFGGMGSWSPNNMFGLKAQGYYSFVLNEIEERHATFKNSIVKIGPSVEADVKWQYFVGNLDLNISHFSAKDITGLIGYQFYYKRNDQIKFKKSKTSSWLGSILENGKYKTYEMELDPLLAEVHTNSISHRLRFETSFVMTDWLEFFAGGAWTFAGRNSLRSIDGHAGFNIAF